MTAVVTTNVPGTRTLLGTGNEMNTLPNGSYVLTGPLTANGATDIMLEVEATPGTVSGGQQLLVFVQVSADGTNYSTGPTSSTTTTNQPNLYQIGTLPLNTSSTIQRRAFSVLAALGFVPPYLNVIVFNNSGASLASSGNAVHYTTFTGSSQ